MKMKKVREMEKSAQEKLAKFLAVTVFGVGFVAPLMFANIARAGTEVKPTGSYSNNVIVLDTNDWTLDGETQTGSSPYSNVYGGYCSSSDAAASNSLTISSGTYSGKVYGGYSVGGDATNNTVELQSGNLYAADIYGGYSEDSGADVTTGNTLKISGSNDYGIGISVNSVNNFQNYVFNITIKVSNGGTMLKTDATSGIDFTNSTFELVINSYTSLREAGQTITLLDYGAELPDDLVSKFGTISYGTLSKDYDKLKLTLSRALVLDVIPTTSANNNTVYVTSATTATINGDSAPNCDASSWGSVCGGYSEEAEASGNTVVVNGGSIENNVFGGYAPKANDNRVIFNAGVILTGGSHGDIAGGLGTEEGGEANNNVVEIYAEELVTNNPVCGGLVWNDNGNVRQNRVTVEAGNLMSVAGGMIFGDGGYAGENEVNIKGGTVSYVVGGGAGEAEGNKVNISGGTMNSAIIFGGVGQTVATANVVTIESGCAGSISQVMGGYGSDVRENAVTIKGGTYSDVVYGGYSMTSGAANGNTVEILGGVFENAKVYGGCSDEGNARNNKVILNGGALSAADIYGGYAPNGTSSGNEIIVKAKGMEVKSVQNFQNYTFNIPSNIGLDGSEAMLKINTTALSFNTGDVFTVYTEDLAEAGGTITLVNETAATGGNFTNVFAQDKVTIVVDDVELTTAEQFSEYFQIDNTSGSSIQLVIPDSFKFTDTVMPAVALTMKYAEEGSKAQEYLAGVLTHNRTVEKAAMVGELNALADMPEQLGVMHGQFAVSNLTEEAVANHLTLNNKSEGKEVWAEAIHTKETVGGLGLDVQANEFTAQYNGAVVGADLVKKEKSTLGIALTYVDGKISGNCGKNDSEYYGAILYGRTEVGKDLGVLYDMTYTWGKNDLNFRSNLTGAEITGDQNANSFSLGARLEKEVRFGTSSLTPHIGARWLRMDGGSFTNSLGMSYDSASTDTIIIPVGIKFKATHENQGWKMSFLADGGYQWNEGDRDYENKVSYNGTKNSFNTDFVDKDAWYAGVGLEFNKNNLTFSLGGKHLKSDNTKQNRWFANVSYAF